MGKLMFRISIFCLLFVLLLYIVNNYGNETVLEPGIDCSVPQMPVKENATQAAKISSSFKYLELPGYQIEVNRNLCIDGMIVYSSDGSGEVITSHGYWTYYNGRWHKMTGENAEPDSIYDKEGDRFLYKYEIPDSEMTIIMYMPEGLDTATLIGK